MPNVILEAMACGLPVVATAVDGTRDVVINNETGRLATGRSKEELATLIAQTLTDRATTRELAFNALQHVRKSFSWDIVVDSYDQLLRRLVAA